MDWGDPCLKPVVGEFACIIRLLADVCDDGATCSVVSLLRTLAGSSSGPVALFWLRFFNCLIIPFVPISRVGMLEYNEGSITGMVADEYRGKLVVEGIFLIAVVCDW